MFHTRNSSHNEAEFVLLDQLVEEEHPILKIGNYISASQICRKIIVFSLSCH